MNTTIKIVIGVAFLIGFGFSLSWYETSDNHPNDRTQSADTHPSGTQYMQWYPQPRKISEFTLTNHKHMMMTNADLNEQWTLAFVGYTYCPDICPTTLAALNQAYPMILEKAQDDPIKVWFLSVDPKRDTIERLAEYIGFFNPNFVAATAEHKELYPLVRSMGMMYSMSQSTDEPNYLVDHSGSVVVINPLGQVIGRFKPSHAPGQIAISDTEQIIADLPKVIRFAAGQ